MMLNGKVNPASTYNDTWINYWNSRKRENFGMSFFERVVLVYFLVGVFIGSVFAVLFLSFFALTL